MKSTVARGRGTDGERRSFPSNRLSALVSCALILAITTASGCGKAPDPYNVIVIVPDTVRADHLSINGYQRKTTPNLDALASEGTNFTTAITVAPRTWQSFSSILTGLFPPNHGVRFIFDHPISPETPTIGSLLTKQGYATAAFDDLPFLLRMTGNVGFGEYVLLDRSRKGENRNAIVLDQAWEWISRERTGPFLAFIRLSGTHWPYAGERFIDNIQSCLGHDHSFNWGVYGIEKAGIGKGVRLKNPEQFRRLIWNTEMDDDTRRHMIAHYDAELMAVDDYIGQFVGRLREAGLIERTVIVVTSDHGESFGEHGYLQHGPRVDEPVMRVPLMVHLPSDHPSFNPGSSVSDLVRTVDILPTVLESIGAPQPEALDGVSLLPLIRGETQPPRWAYAETGRSFVGVDPERHFPGIEGKHRMIRTADWKLVVIPEPGGAVNRLYDLRSDPGESRDLAHEQPDKVEELRAHLRAVMASEEVPDTERELSEQEKDMLRSLGYLN